MANIPGLWRRLAAHQGHQIRITQLGDLRGDQIDWWAQALVCDTCGDVIADERAFPETGEKEVQNAEDHWDV